MEELTDKELGALIERVRAGNDESFSQLVDRYMPLINALIVSMKPRSVEYEEAFSEACISLHRAAKSYNLSQKDVTFGLFARICISRRLRAYFLQNREEYESLDESSAVLESGCEVEDELIAEESFRSLMSGIRALLSEYEYTVLLYHMQGYKASQIAELMGRSVKSVENAKMRVFRRLREHKELFSE